MAKIKIINVNKLRDFVRRLHELGLGGMVVAVLLIGDRFSCCDEAVAIEKDGEVVGVATIAPEGEMGSDGPSIVGVYVIPFHRGNGFGKELMAAAVERCADRGFEKVRYDLLSSRMRHIIEMMPSKLRERLVVNDMGSSLDNSVAEEEQRVLTIKPAPHGPGKN